MRQRTIPLCAITRVSKVGSPTTQAVTGQDFSISFHEPVKANSSSAIAANTTGRGRSDRFAYSITADIIAAIEAFASHEPRPNTQPFSITGSNGLIDMLSTGTVSICELSIRPFALLP